MEVKVALVGPSDVGKSSLIKFLKECNFENENQDSNSYQESWGISVNVVEWDYQNPKTGQLHVLRFGLWESGGSFLKKFPFYNQYLLKDANVVIYMLSLTLDENLSEKAKLLIEETRTQFQNYRSQNSNQNLNEILLLTKVDQGYLINQNQISEVKQTCKGLGIENVQVIGIPFNERLLENEDKEEENSLQQQYIDQHGKITNKSKARHALANQILNSLSEASLKDQI
eukprot:403335682